MSRTASAPNADLPAPQPTPGRHIFAPHVRYALSVLILLALTRLGLTLWQHARWDSGGDLGLILSYGLRMDLIIVCYTLIPAVLLSVFLGGAGTVGTLVAKVVRLYLIILFALFVFLEAATPLFIQEYDMRPNRLFIEYLVHPEEVSSMLITGYAMPVIVVTLLTAAIAYLGSRLISTGSTQTRRTPIFQRAALFLVAAPALFLGARSSLQHRPANPSSVAMWNDHLVNDLCLSSLYSVAYAAQQMKDESDAADVYGKLDSEATIIQEVRAGMLTVRPDQFLSDECPTMHRQEATHQRDKPLNLVIILEESLGAQYIEELGGEPITQFIDTLADESWWFDNLYATGTRSVRGIEAVIAGFLPTPARSVVKLGLSQTGFFTMASLLKSRGFLTQFFYGGEAHFDNMRRFFSGNGFDEIIDHDKIDDVTFDGSWGVCDEDVFRQAHKTFEAQSKTGQPFFSVIFSVSNHSPFDYPAGKIELIEPDPAAPLNAVRYADFALGEFIKDAKASSYWDNTVFLIVADHDARVHGASLVPIEHFHIPAVILGADVRSRRDARLVSQIDLPPTLLSLIGISAEHPMIGYDLTALPEEAEGRAIVQYGSNQGYLTPTEALIMQPHQEAKQFNWSGAKLEPMTLDETLKKRALAHALLPSLLYSKQLYKAVPPRSAEECATKPLGPPVSE